MNRPLRLSATVLGALGALGMAFFAALATAQRPDGGTSPDPDAAATSSRDGGTAAESPNAADSDAQAPASDASEPGLDAGANANELDGGKHAPLPQTQPVAVADGGVTVGEEDQTTASCVEHVPQGATRPKLSVSLPKRGLSGYAVRLTVVVGHGAGETVLPEGFKLQRHSEAADAIKAAGFVIPEPDGGVGPTATRSTEQTATKTTLSIPFVALPPEPGRHELILPPIPISVARANGEVTTVCTAPQKITIDDPIANETDPSVKPNPPPRPQREPWDTAKYITIGVLAGLALGLLAFWLIRKWLRRPRVVPAAPPVLPWVAAMAELDRLRASRLLDQQKNAEYYDQVNDCIRKYLGDRYGFDGLESTTEEIRYMLGRVVPPPPEVDRVWRFLADSDLVKFADVRPNQDECKDALNRAVEIVRVTTPPAANTAPSPSGPAAPPPATSGRPS